MKLVILGNGFDLHHGLKTSFNDFKGWCKENREEEFVGKIDDIIEQFLEEDNVQSLDWSNVENIFHKKFLKVRNTIMVKEKYKGYSPKGHREKLIEQELGNYRSKYDIDGFEEITIEFTEKFNRYLEEEVISKIGNIKLNPKIQEELNSDCHVITFNYTNVHEEYDIKENVLCIHGSIRDGGYPVIGCYHNVGDEETTKEDYKERYKERILSKEVIYERMHGEELLPVINDFFDSIKGFDVENIFPNNLIDEIVIIGYSIGENDDYITNLMFENSKMHQVNSNIRMRELDVTKVRIYNYDKCFENGKNRIIDLLKKEKKYKVARVIGEGIRPILKPNVEFIKDSYTSK